MKITPYLHFKDNCEEAFKFYEAALGGKIVMVSRFKDAPPPPEGAGNNDGCVEPMDMSGMGEKIMHIRLVVGDSILMGSDTPPVFEHKGKVEGCTIALGFDTGAEAEKVFAALAKRGKVTMPVAETFWAERFGMLDDEFGVSWMVNGGEKTGP
ncbi:VOC family protein [Luteibacter aegosomaticola]|uniref:VOC family protein n=1 Tax=Luteibacter aegosomaticola TaxID=2911538 RepID=UPI001FFB4793|nr:VOC family protein [Luteibacter aegosomaticola]UPG90337.1 VOC family protein [Luteibacter aegosomaticola]